MITFLLLTLALLVLHGFHFLGITLAVERTDVQTREIGFEEGFELGEEFGIGAVGARVVVDDKFIVGGVFDLGVFFRRPAANVVGWVALVLATLVWWGAQVVLESPDEELARESDICCNV